MNVMGLCSGGGGLELGIHIATGGRSRAVCYVEREAFAIATLVAAMEAGHLAPAPVWTDLVTFDGKPWRGVVDLICAGFPCQPFSAAGEKRGLDDERWLWPDIERIIRDVGPSLVFLENVPGVVVHGAPAVLGSLAALGYDAEWGVLGADDVGAPHRRKRWWCLAYLPGHLADLDRDGQQIEWLRWILDGQREVGGDDADGCCEGLADAMRPRLQRGEQFASLRDSEGARPHGPTAELRVPWVDDPLRGRHGDKDEAIRPRRDGAVDAGWPPRPGDADGWRRYVEAGGPEPALRRGADGMADRVDRLRLLGNGVVPLAATYAFRTLAARAVTG